jgi:hypothetical protein
MCCTGFVKKSCRSSRFVFLTRLCGHKICDFTTNQFGLRIHKAYFEAVEILLQCASQAFVF